MRKMKKVCTRDADLMSAGVQVHEEGLMLALRLEGSFLPAALQEAGVHLPISGGELLIEDHWPHVRQFLRCLAQSPAPSLHHCHFNLKWWWESVWTCVRLHIGRYPSALLLDVCQQILAVL